MSVMSPTLDKPAQLTTTSTGPVASNSRCTESSSVTSTAAARCGSPSSAARPCAPSELRSATVTRSPWAASARAVAHPIPDAPPITTEIRWLPLLIQLAFDDGIRTRSNLALWQTRPVTDLKMSYSISVAETPDELYALVSDVTRMGEWSPICRACWWDEGDGPRVGAWFTGRNELPERTWETRCQVVVADRGREFTFVVSATGTRWSYRFRAV